MKDVFALRRTSDAQISPDVRRVAYKEAPLAYWRRSPLSLAGRVRTPTLVMVGEDDHRTPVSEAQQFYAALQLRRVPSALVVVPEAGHDSIQATPSRLIATTAITLDWFSRHGGEPAPAAMAADR